MDCSKVKCTYSHGQVHLFILYNCIYIIYNIYTHLCTNKLAQPSTARSFKSEAEQTSHCPPVSTTLQLLPRCSSSSPSTIRQLVMWAFLDPLWWPNSWLRILNGPSMNSPVHVKLQIAYHATGIGSNLLHIILRPSRKGNSNDKKNLIAHLPTWVQRNPSSWNNQENQTIDHKCFPLLIAHGQTHVVQRTCHFKSTFYVQSLSYQTKPTKYWSFQK